MARTSPLPRGSALVPTSPVQCPVVGIGASAGGHDAFRDFFAHVPRDAGAAFVVVQHFPNDRESHLPEVLRPHTELPIEMASDDAAVAANRIYVVPAGATAVMERGRLRLGPSAQGPPGRIDRFLVALARDQRDLAVAVILSGLDADGAEGARAVEEHGGLALIQAPETAQFEVMPRAALDRVLSGPALPLDQLARTLVRHVAAVAAVCQGPRTLSRGVGEIPPEIWSVVQESTGRDLSGYRPGTVARRIARRMQELDLDALSAYLDRLRGDPHEPAALLQQLLIGVTAFFRDEDVFRGVEERILPRLAAEAGSGELRIWVPGCSTGEEAYSLAILAQEAVERAASRARVQVFATDLDAHALEVARAGRYPRQACQRISPARLARFFTAREDGWDVSKELRESCLFSIHHVTGDPPFSRLDLVSCRNLLIYLENELKRQVLPIFHYALRPGGALVLGPSESISEHDDLFAPVDARLRIFQRRDTPSRPPPRFRLSVRGSARSTGAPGARPASAPREASMKSTIEQILLRELAPACAVVDAHGQVLHLSGPVNRFLEPPQGPPTNNVVDMARGSLRLEVRTALHKAAKGGDGVVQRDVAVEVEGRPARVDVVVRPLPGGEPERFLVAFREREPAVQPAPDAAAAGGDETAAVEALRAELRSTKEHLQATIEELESSNAQLKTSNEELVTVNEELQTSQEELQSLNEELEALNAELSAKVEAVDRANADLQNLFQSTQLAAIFLGKDLAIKRFTPAATQLFRVLEADVGRPITDLALPFADAELAFDVATVLGTLTPRERPIRLDGPRPWYVLRILPYLTLDGRIDGAVVTFSDVTDMKRAEETVRAAERTQRELLSAIPQLVWTASEDGARDYVSKQWIDYTGIPAAEHLGWGWVQVVHPDDREKRKARWRAAYQHGTLFEDESRIRRADGAYRWFQTRAVPLRDEAGRVTRWFGTSTDVDDLKRATAALQGSERRLRAAIDSFPGVFVLYDRDRRIVHANAVAEALAGKPAAELVGLRDEDVAPAEVLSRCLPALERTLRDAAPQALELDLAVGGEPRTFALRYAPLLDGDGRPELVIAAALDITERKRMEDALREADRRKDEFLALLGHELRNPLAPLQNAVQLLRRRRDDAEADERSLQMMERQIAQLARLLDDLLDMERITRGKIQLRRAPLDLVALVGGVVEDHRALLAEAGLRLEVNLPAGPLPADGDATRLAQAVGNLLNNAAKFTERGGEVTVELRRADAGSRAEIAVRDTGIGMDPEFLARAFQPFAQAEGTLARSRGGLGLGLAVVKRVVELHGGTVRAASAGPGRGAEFVVVLPVDPPARAAAVAGPDEAPRPRRILLVDDNTDAAESLAELLAMEGHTVQVTSDGASAVACAREFHPEVVLCDIGLPGELDGYAVARAFRAAPSLCGTFLVALTGYASAEHQRRAREAGFDRHLAKPPSLDRIAQVLAAAGARPPGEG